MGQRIDDPKQTLRGRHPMLTSVVVIRFPDCVDSQFCHSQEFHILSFSGNRSGYQQKDRKPSQNDKTEHGMEKTVQNQGQSPKMPKSESIQKIPAVQTEPELEVYTIGCILNHI
ncbi:hypothetical protein Tco_1069166 [Tanacetum coccineum]|uniref:Uncharacterized protein n=1 Tax=Tanacetum coccineum TaxID=301880 RepID=A0ABQ5HJ84_9ASTR